MWHRPRLHTDVISPGIKTVIHPSREPISIYQQNTYVSSQQISTYEKITIIDKTK